MQNHDHDDTRRTPDDGPSRARDFGLMLLAAKLSGDLVLCSGCGRPCAECGDGCNDALAAWTNRPAA